MLQSLKKKKTSEFFVTQKVKTCIAIDEEVIEIEQDREEAAEPSQEESPACTELSGPPVRQSSSSSSAQSPDLAEFLARGCSAGGSPCPDLLCF